MIEHDEAGKLLREVVETVRAFHVAKHRSRSGGLTGTKIGVLQQLSSCGDARTTELADRLLVSLPVASRAVAALEDDGFVVRRPDPSDARAALLSITTEGTAHLTARQERVVGLFADGLSDWTPEEAAQAAAILSRLREHVTDVFDKMARPDSEPVSADAAAN